MIGGDASVFERTVDVNLRGVYYTLRAAGPHIAHPNGYALAISSLAAAVHPPLLAAYSASKAGVEALGDALRIELASSGARVGVAYFAELDTDMTSRGFGTEAAESPVRAVFLQPGNGPVVPSTGLLLVAQVPVGHGQEQEVQGVPALTQSHGINRRPASNTACGMAAAP